MDVAGLEDTSGELIEVVNSLILKRLFVNANSIRFLVPIAVGQVVDGRGEQMRKYGKLIKDLLDHDLPRFISSVQPLITKVQPNKDVRESGFRLRRVIADQLEKCVGPEIAIMRERLQGEEKSEGRNDELIKKQVDEKSR